MKLIDKPAMRSERLGPQTGCDWILCLSGVSRPPEIRDNSFKLGDLRRFRAIPRQIRAESVEHRPGLSKHMSRERSRPLM